MPGQVFGQADGIGDVGVHAQGQRLEALKEQEGVERGQAGAEIAQLLDSQLRAESVLPEVVPEAQIAVARLSARSCEGNDRWPSRNDRSPPPRPPWRSRGPR